MATRRIDRPKTPPKADNAPDQRDQSAAGAPFPIVGVGASAGGLEAFTELLKNLPVDTGMGFVLVQHLDPLHESALPQLLTRATALPVSAVANNMRVEANRIYVIPPNTDLRVAHGVLKLQPRRQTPTPHRSIDSFFESLAEDQRERAVGVILSGTASDGTLGLEAIKAEGGITFAQDESARYDSMPRSAVAAGCVDFVLSPKNIASELARISKHPFVAGRAHEADSPDDDRAYATARSNDGTALPLGVRGSPPTDETLAYAEAEEASGKVGESGYKKILLILRKHSGVDFSLYKSTTIQRRIARRMVLSKHDSVQDYENFLRGNVKELDALYSDVLISVTSFFRNPEAFDVLKATVFPELLQSRGDAPVRVWVLGCSTGQEAYSIAMAFVEVADNATRMRKLQIFATDLNDALLDKARHGLYAKSLASDISPARLRRFFVEEEGGYRISKQLREMTVFARQNVVSDPPFSRIDLISCRNLLIYLEPSLQKKAFPTFHYALKPQGVLFLGASESIGTFTDLFEPLDRKHRIYVKKAVATPVFLVPRIGESGEHASRSRPGQVGTPSAAQQGEDADGSHAELSALHEADRLTVNRFAPPGVLIDSDLKILQFRGATSAYLAPPTGKASFDVLKMAREGLMLPLRAVIDKAKKENKTAHRDNVHVQENGTTRIVNLEVVPLKNLREPCFLILFVEVEKGAHAVAATKAVESHRRKPARPAQKEESRRIAALEVELGETRDYLRAVQEQYEAANEELQAVNEEVQSANEELQSINEELETSKEELESANEELTTVNEEMANRNAEFSRLNSDLVNVQNSAQLAIVLLGRDLIIRHFSAQAEKQFCLVAADRGRPLTSIRHNLELPDVERVVAQVIETVRASEQDLQDKDGRWFSLRVRPYLTLDRKVDGAVLMLVDIDDLKRSEQAISAARDYAERIVETVREPLLVLDSELRVESASRSFYETFCVAPTETVGKFIYDLGDREWDVPRLRALLEEILPQSLTIEDFPIEHEFRQLGHRTMLLNARQIHHPHGMGGRILLAIEDVTERAEIEAELRESEERYRTLFDSIDEGFCIVEMIFDEHEKAVDYRFLRVSASFEKQTGLKDAQGKRMRELSPQHEEHWFEIYGKIALTGKPARFQNRADQLQRWYDVYAFRFGAPEKRQVAVLFNNITERKQTENALRESEERSRSLTDTLRESDRHKNEFLAMLAHELRSPLAPIRNSLEIMRRVAGIDASTAQPTAALSHESGSARHFGDIMESAVGTMERQVGQMVRLVDDLLDVGRISRGKIGLRTERVEFLSVVHHAVDAVRPLCESNGQELTMTLPVDPVYLTADPTRLAQILGNLLNNALKFTPRGGRIWVTVERDGSPPLPDDSETKETLLAALQSTAGKMRAEAAASFQRPHVVMRVRDTGIGISADQLPRVFDLFMQGDTSLERSLSGLGIGLTLVRSVVDMHGGTVEARSAGVGQGSEFTVRLPILVEASIQPSAPIPSEPKARMALRILVVDDNQDSAESLGMLLQLSGHETQAAYDGFEATDAAMRFRPDVILLDIGLPKLNGYEVCRSIREQPWGRNIVVIALTGWGQDDDRRKSKEAGFNGHLVKPVDPAALMALLADRTISGNTP